jgi:hypothetical protein
MMRLRGPIFLTGLALALSHAPQLTTAQGKGGGKGHGGGGGQAQGKGDGKAKGESQGPSQGEISRQRGRSDEARAARADRGVARSRPAVGRAVAGAGRNRFTRQTSLGTMPGSVRRFAASGHPRDIILAAAVSHAFARGRGDELRLVPVGNGVRLANRNGDALVFLDDESARSLGIWRVGVLDNGLREGAPSFCRSGAGHPVWGRQWCIDKGFGLGTYQDFRWGRTTDVGDVFFVPAMFGSPLVGSTLTSVLGSSAFNRLALHAVTLGLVQPLTGMWVAQPTGPRLLMVNSGPMPVAEFVDVNRDNRADNMLVALRPWY